jgi:phage-related protein
MTTNRVEWSIVYYTEANGASPVREFLESLDDKTQVRFGWAIEQLRIRNVQASEPLVKHIEGKLWELRRDSGTNTFRVFYFFFIGRKIVLLHGFQKKTQRTPRQEIETAKRRMNDFLSKAGGE